MVFRRRKRQEQRARRDNADTATYSEVMRNRLAHIAENGGYEYDENEAAEVEARLRRMFYGAKKEDDF
jgi:hypothetical protein